MTDEDTTAANEPSEDKELPGIAAASGTFTEAYRDRHVNRVLASRFIRHLSYIQDHYESWAADGRFQSISQQLFLKQPALRSCHASRICDFLVWTVGAAELSQKKKQ